MPTLRQLLAQAAAELERGGIAEPRLTAAALLLHVLGRDRAYLYAHPEAQLTPEQQTLWETLVAQRSTGAPLQYITGTQEFYGRSFRVSPAVLIPRPETEQVVEAALERLPGDAPARVVDVGTGSGCIAITLALGRPQATVLATDISAPALAVARENAQTLQARVQFVEGDLLAGLVAPFDLIVSNPPYIADRELGTLQPEVRGHEPRVALAAGPLGTEIYARLIPQAAAALRAGGWLVLELGYSSAEAVRAMLGAAWEEIETRRDLQGWERVLVARRAGG